MKYNKLRTMFAAVILLLALGLAIAQMLDPSAASPAHYLPKGALVYAEARNLKDLLSWWSQSRVKANWAQSRNFEQFQNSRLFLKLKDRAQEYGGDASFRFTLDQLNSIAGTRSALALYNIGELKAVAITQISFPEAEASQLWLTRSSFLKKTVEGIDYYTEPKNKVLSFAYSRPYLVIGTDEDLVKNALLTMSDSTNSNRLDQSELWQKCQAMKPAGGDISLFLDQQTLNSNRYFQKYWIHQNVKSLAGIEAVWIDLQIAKGEILEERYFVMGNNLEPGSEQDLKSYLAPFEQLHHEYLSLETSPDTNTIAGRVLNFINRFPEKYEKTSYPPAYSAAFERASQAETPNIYAQQIDEPILRPASESLMSANQHEEIARLLTIAKPSAQIRLSYPLWDDKALFVQFPETLIVQLDQFDGLDQQQFLTAVREYFLILNSTHGDGVRWTAGTNGEYTLESWNKIYVRFQKPWILISNREMDFGQAAQILPSAATVPLGSFREVDWKDGRWKYSRLMKRLDYGSYHGEEPLFFSENLDSLLYTLEPIQRSTVLQIGSREMVTYETQ